MFLEIYLHIFNITEKSYKKKKNYFLKWVLGKKFETDMPVKFFAPDTVALTTYSFIENLYLHSSHNGSHHDI